MFFNKSGYLSYVFLVKFRFVGNCDLPNLIIGCINDGISMIVRGQLISLSLLSALSCFAPQFLMHRKFHAESVRRMWKSIIFVCHEVLG